jgi:hypothetical protein
MKLFSRHKIFILLLIIILNIKYLSQKIHKPRINTSKLEKAYKECLEINCLNRIYDESCIYKCISLKCFKLIYEKSNYILEFGEIDLNKKSYFEKCYYEFINK